MYKIELSKKADKAIRTLPKFIVVLMRNKFEALSTDISLLKQFDTITNPKSIGIDETILYKMRVGDYRCLFIVEDAIITITIIEIEHRSKVYRKK